MLLLNNEEIAAAVTMDMALARMRLLYSEIGAGLSVSTPRADLYHRRQPTAVPDRVAEEPTAHYLKTMSGGYQGGGVAALRLSSDLVRRTRVNGELRNVKEAVRPGRWVGLILIFSLDSGEPLGILHDGFLQRLRVGATSALADDYLARTDAERVGIIGSGAQARAHLEATALVRRISEVRVWSPNERRRDEFASEMAERVNAEITPVDSADAAADRADILMTATNSRGAVVSDSAVRPGLHISTLNRYELPETVYDALDRVVVHTHSFESSANAEALPGADEAHYSSGSLRRFPTLADLAAGREPGRGSADEATGFVNNLGLGSQFAAIGELAISACGARGLGRELDTELFLEDLHP